MKHTESKTQIACIKWIPIEGYEGRYLVSNTGSVKSLVSTHNGRTPKRNEHILKQYESNGYLRVGLTKQFEKPRYHFVHRLVLSSFKDKSNLFVNHIDGNKSNNNLENLEWVTRSENQKHAYKIGLQKPVDNGLKKTIQILKDDIVICEEVSIRELSRKYKIHRIFIHSVLKGKLNNYKGLKFKIV